MKFKELNVGDTFDWINPTGGTYYNSFFKRCTKIDRFRYIAEGETEKYRVGSLDATVYHVNQARVEG